MNFEGIMKWVKWVREKQTLYDFMNVWDVEKKNRNREQIVTLGWVGWGKDSPQGEQPHKEKLGDA